MDTALTLPEYLKSTRERLAYTLNEVSHLTNISEKFLASIESGQYHRLPADAYVFGFLRSLAELYHADPASLVEQYKHEHALGRESIKAAQQYKTFTPPKFAVTPRTITVGAILVFAVFILGYLFYQVHSVSQPPTIVVTSPHDGDVIHASSVVVTGRVDVGDQLDINDQAVLVDSSGDFSQSVSLTPGSLTLSFVAKNSFGKTSTKNVSIVADFQNPDAGASSAAGAAGPQQTGLSLDVVTSADNVTVTIQADANQPVTILFTGPTSKVFTAQQKIVIGTSNAGATDVQLNGKDLGKLGKNGQSLQGVVFTSDSLGGAAGTPTPTQ